MTIQPKRTYQRLSDIPEPEVVAVGERQEPGSGPAKFVTVLHDRVGRYAKGSIVHTSAFGEQSNVTNLIDNLGAIEYNYEATEESFTGNPEHDSALAGLQMVMTQTLPIAPWATASASNILGAKYIPLNRAQHGWQPSAVVAVDAEPATQEVPFNPA